MALGEWLEQFRVLHEEAKRGKLTGQQLSDYYGARDELAQVLLAAQHIAIEPGQKPRRALRVSRALQAEITTFDGTVRVVTRSISSGGFAALLTRPPKLGEDVKVVLRLPGSEPLHAEARVVVDVKGPPGSGHVSFRWRGLSDAEIERIETFVFDVALEQLQSR
ncbi:MAG TPA: PilZ domain-containing protein [Candidatus Methylomirabilis sp.]|nr:PilZ domain-containing protein [Candidatus Methylomirabilis sp.]